LAIDRGLQHQHMRLSVLPAFGEQANALLMFAFELQEELFGILVLMRLVVDDFPVVF